MIYASQFATSRIYLGHGFDVFICIHTFSHWTSSAYETPKTIIRLRSNGKTHLEGINRAHSIYLLLLSHLQFIGWFSFLHIITTLLLMIGSTYMLSLWTKAFTYLHLKITNTICTRVCQMCQSFKKSWLSFIFPLLDLNGWQKHQYYQIIWILEGGSTTPKFIVYSMKGESEQIGSSLKNHRRSNAINFNLTYVWGVLYQSPLMC